MMRKNGKCAFCGAEVDTIYADNCWACGKNYEESRGAKKAARPKRPTASALRKMERRDDEKHFLATQERYIFCIFDSSLIKTIAGGLTAEPGAIKCRFCRELPSNWGMGSSMATAFAYNPLISGSHEAAKKAATECGNLLGAGKITEAFQVETAHKEDFLNKVEKEAELRASKK